MENDLLMAVEFDDAEILEAIRHPVMKFNEMPPPLTPFTCKSFPFGHHWRNAIVAELMKTAAHHYMRNALKVSSGGLNVDDKNKYNEYLQFASLYIREWEDFITQKKVEINAGMFFGSQQSTYGVGFYNA